MGLQKVWGKGEYHVSGTQSRYGNFSFTGIAEMWNSENKTPEVNEPFYKRLGERLTVCP
jgi:hypothetical protein